MNPDISQQGAEETKASGQPDPEVEMQERGDWFTDLVLRFFTWLARSVR